MGKEAKKSIFTRSITSGFGESCRLLSVIYICIQCSSSFWNIHFSHIWLPSFSPVLYRMVAVRHLMHLRMAMCVEKAVAQPFSHCWSLDFKKDMIEDAGNEDVGTKYHGILLWSFGMLTFITGVGDFTLSSTHWKTFFEFQQTFRKKRVGEWIFSKIPQLFCNFWSTSNTYTWQPFQPWANRSGVRTRPQSQSSHWRARQWIRSLESATLELEISETTFCGSLWCTKVVIIVTLLHLKNLKPVGGGSAGWSKFLTDSTTWTFTTGWRWDVPRDGTCFL